MVPVLNIDKMQPGLYSVNISKSGMRLFDEDVAESIADGLKVAADTIPEELAAFALVWYADVCIGMRPLQDLAQQSEKIAKELTDLAHAVWTAEEAMQAP